MMRHSQTMRAASRLLLSHPIVCLLAALAAVVVLVVVLGPIKVVHAADVTASSARLVGAGDIGSNGDADIATGDLIDARPDARVFTAGDNAYPNGSPSDFTNKYHPAWGPFKNRTSPTPGNHEYYTPGPERARMEQSKCAKSLSGDENSKVTCLVVMDDPSAGPEVICTFGAVVSGGGSFTAFMHCPWFLKPYFA
jgi:hypothetical protein